MNRIQKLITVLAIILSISAIFTHAAFSGQDSAKSQADRIQSTPISYPLSVFLPLFHNQLTFSVSGRVTDANHHPVSDVTITDHTGRSTLTDSNGNYVLSGLSGGNYALAPSKNGYVFSPSVMSVDVPPGAVDRDFAALTACTEAIVNGGFENDTAWQFPLTPYPANYSTAVKRSGSRSARTGIVSGTNVYSYSSTRQLLNIPSGIASATLRLWLYPLSSESLSAPVPRQPEVGVFGDQVLTYDAQYVLVLDPGSDPEKPDDDTLLETLYWTRTNSQQWEYKEFSLTKYAGRSIKIQAGTYNDGWGGITAMYVDDVSVEICPTTGATATPTITPTPVGCVNLLSNSGFEYTGVWDIPITEYPAGYTSDRAYAGTRSMRTGIPNVAWNKYSYSDAGQWITIPANATSASLHLRFYPQSGEGSEKVVPVVPAGSPFGEAPLASDAQYVLILDQSYNWTAIFWDRRNTQQWTYFQYSLLAYAGKTIKVQFGAYNDGADGVTAMYVDEVYVDTCTSTPPTPTRTPTPVNTPTPTATVLPGTPSPTPVGCYEGVVNSGFEQVYAWEIPITAFSAGYSADKAHAGWWSMRTGIVSTAWNRFSYSDARQRVTIPVGTQSALLRIWYYPISGETGILSGGGVPTGRPFGDEILAGDVQYFLILDQDYNWIDTLLWMRANTQQWTYATFDLVGYAGDTINLQFGTYNDGSAGVTAMYVDDVSLQVCP